MGYAWGGSEELWSRTALELVAQGFSVSASMRGSEPPHPRVLSLIEGGVEVWLRPIPAPVSTLVRRAVSAPVQMFCHAWRVLANPKQSATAMEGKRLLAAKLPNLVV